MELFSSFLEKYTNLLSSNAQVKKVAIGVIKKEVGVDLDPKEIKLSGESLTLLCSSVIKNEVQFQKDLIIKEIYQQTGYRISNIY